MHFYLVGKELNGAIADVGDLRAQASPDVTVTVAQDLDIAALDSKFTTHAAVGTLVGVKASQPVNINVGYVQVNNIQDKANGLWVNPGTSANAALSTYDETPGTGDFDALGTKGFNLLQTYTGTPGVYYNDDPTCELATNDFYSASNCEVWNKAFRLVYVALTPKVNGPVLVNADTGQLSASYCQDLEETGEAALQAMLRAGEISGKKVTVDPNQDVNTTSEIVCSF